MGEPLETPLPPESAHEPSGCDAARLRQLERERDEALTNWKRSLADFQNYQRRSFQNEQEARREGITSVLASVFPVIDHFDIALTQTAPDDASRRIMDGVRVIRDELVKALEKHGVTIINPAPNELFDPTRHQAVMQHPADGVEPGHISAVMQVGYSLDGRIVRSAMVGVAPAEQA